jgi:hypothetical protein
VEPTIVHETGPDFWQERRWRRGNAHGQPDPPDTTNWGYDVVIAAWAR